jgi:hypothetical protein
MWWFLAERWCVGTLYVTNDAVSKIKIEIG